ncbi:MAG: transcriptional regulator [Gammaproteobacteria bacterium]|nr:transcriptional regulator [Gammaproteobacteria bacterium]|tara:strand:+ start:1119 stop:1538 length:420 start_codon:yes stop_codon:yes gene_type:complete
MTTSTPSDLILKLAALHTMLQKQIAGPLSYHGISFTEYQVLKQLHDAPAQKMRRIDLAQQIGLSASGVTRMLNPMEKVGLVSKEEAARDARVSLVTLTTAGQTVFRDAEASFRQAAGSVLASVIDADQQHLHRIADSLL